LLIIIGVSSSAENPTPSRRGRPVDPDARATRIRQILDGARRCFLRKGFHASSTAEISAEAGVSVANLYQYFPTKDDLVLALVEDDLRCDLELVAMVAHAPTLREGLQAAIAAMLADTGLSDLSRLRLDVLTEATRRPAVATAVRAAEEKMTAAIATLLERARNDGEIDGRMDPRPAATLILALIDGLGCRFAFQAEGIDAQGQSSTLFILRALGARGD
jgi:AcrR family transcriptional regulator